MGNYDPYSDSTLLQPNRTSAYLRVTLCAQSARRDPMSRAALLERSASFYRLRIRCGLPVHPL